MTFQHLILAAALAASAAFAQSATVPNTDLSSLAWMAGHWSGSVNQRQIEENWLVPKAGAMFGVSRTVVKDRTVEFEFLRIEKREDAVYYVAQPGGRPPTGFKLTRSETGLAVFENPEHDFPKVITYRLEEANRLVATVEGDVKGKARKIEFRLERLGGISR